MAKEKTKKNLPFHPHSRFVPAVGRLRPPVFRLVLIMMKQEHPYRAHTNRWSRIRRHC
jgi:hypothetical protein